MLRKVWLFLLFTSFIAVARAQNPLYYNRVFLFGDSLTDISNVYNVTSSYCLGSYSPCYPYPDTPYNYAQGVFTDGTGTIPQPLLYGGVWHNGFPLFYSSTLENGGYDNGGFNVSAEETNYAWDKATTQDGTATVAEGPFTVTIENMGQQVTDYINSGQGPNSRTIYVLFGGMYDLLADSSSASSALAAQRLTALVQRLAATGATNFLVPNLPPLISNSNTQYVIAAANFRVALNNDLTALQTQLALTGKPINVTQVDLYSLFSSIIATPAAYGFTNVSTAANTLPDTTNPDTYLNWDGINPTGAAHHQIAIAACTAMTQTRTTISASAATSTVANPATLTATVSTSGTWGPPATLQPTGTVTFYSGHTALGTAALQANGTATLSALNFASGTINVTAVYSGDANFYTGCESSAISLNVISGTPEYKLAFSPSTLTTSDGLETYTNVTATSINGYNAALTISCGTLPADFSCTVLNAAIKPGTTAAATVQILAEVLTGTVQPAPDLSHSIHRGAVVAFAIPFGLLAVFYRRRKLSGALLVLLITFTVTSLTSCSGGSPGGKSSGGGGGTGGGGGGTGTPTYAYPQPGTYTIPIVATASDTSATTTTNITLVVQ